MVWDIELKIDLWVFNFLLLGIVTLLLSLSWVILRFWSSFSSRSKSSDLEYAIEDIRKDLEIKTEALQIERDEQATIMSAIFEAILAIDSDGAPLFFNSRFAVLFGNEELKAKKKISEIFERSEILGVFQSALDEGKQASVKAVPFDQPSGRRFFSIQVSPLRKSNGTIYGAVGIFHDVTDLKRAEQMRIDFVANVSHELRTPLTAIKGYADTLIDDARNGLPISVEFLEVIGRNTDRLMNLINDLLDLSSLDSKDSFQKAQLDTYEITSRVIGQMQGVFDSKEQQVEIRSSRPWVLADSRRLEQVLVNLLGNANKYTSEKGKITVHWETHGEKDTVLKVQDNGPGIPIEHHDRLFERFYRIDKARSRDQGGTGLGLAIVKHIMQSHQGAAWVESRSGEGATFICRFPG